MGQDKDPTRVSPTGEDGCDRAFDVWVQRSAHSRWDEVANEPIPEELLRLIEEDRKD